MNGLKNFDIRFIDFSQRRKIGFRGAFEFDNKRLAIASEKEIKILAFFHDVDANQLQDVAEMRKQARSRSPFNASNSRG